MWSTAIVSVVVVCLRIMHPSLYMSVLSVPGRVTDPQPDSVPGGSTQGPACDGGPHDTTTQLLHQTEGREETRRLYHGEDAGEVHKQPSLLSS